MKLLIDDTYINMIEDRILFLEEQMRTMKCNEKAWQKEERENEIDDLIKAMDTIKRWNVTDPIVKEAKNIALASMITTISILSEENIYTNYSCLEEDGKVLVKEEIDYLYGVYKQNLIDKGVK